jgi:GAF domain-containing protein
VLRTDSDSGHGGSIVKDTGLRETPLLSGDEAHRLPDLESSGLLEREDSEPFHRVARLTRRLLGVDTAIVSVIDRDRQVFKGHDGLRSELADLGESALSRSFCRYAVATRERLAIADARVTPLQGGSNLTADHDALAYACVPLVVADGSVLGTLCVLDSSPRNWSAQDLALLDELATVALAEIERRLVGSEVDGVDALAGRLEDPVAKLGDVVRTVAGLIEQAGDESRLPRLADVARSRVTTVEALTSDLVRAARSRHERCASAATVDVRAALEHAAELAGSGAPRDDLVLELPPESVSVEWPATPMNRALTLLVTTAVNHLLPGDRMTVRLTALDDEARVTVELPGAAVPVGQLLRVVGHFRDRDDEELPIDVSSRPVGVEARNALVTATSAATGTRFLVRLPR